MATKKREKLQYARVLVEVSMSQVFPDSVEYEDADGVVVTQPIVYEWKPVVCETCKGMGHSADVCTKKTKPVWRPKVVQQHPSRQEEGGFSGGDKELKANQD